MTFIGARRFLSFSLPCLVAIACGDNGKAPPPTKSETVEVPFQITTEYALEQTGDGDYTARARYYDALQTFDWTGNAGTIALSNGDAAFADGKKLDLETRSEVLGTLRVDYSQTVPKGKARYPFELRRPTETISTEIPAPAPFTMKAEEASPFSTSITWGPVDPSSAIYIQLATEDSGCLLLEGELTRQPADTGSYNWITSAYRSASQDCTYVITVERHTRTTQPAKWKKGSTVLPTNGVHADAIRRETAKLTLTKK